MHVELSYIYIHDIGRCFFNQSINFSNKYEINYEPSSKKLHIRENDNYFHDFWSEKICNISILVGKNGAGKSTLMNIFAETNTNRMNMISEMGKRNSGGWFALYSLTSSNGIPKFIVEGYNPSLLFNNISGIRSDYSFVCDYCFEKSSFTKHSFIQLTNLHESDHTVNDYLKIIYNKQVIKNTCYKSYDNDRPDYHYSFERIRIKGTRLNEFYSFVSDEYKWIEANFGAKSVKCLIAQMDLLETSNRKEEQDSFDLPLYNREITPWYFDKHGLKFYKKLAHQHRLEKESFKNIFIITYLEMYIIALWQNQIRKQLDSSGQRADRYYERITDYVSISYSKRKLQNYNEMYAYLCDVLTELNSVAFEVFDEPFDRAENCYAKAIIDFANSLNDLPEKYFVSADDIEIDVSEGVHDSIKKLLNVYDFYSSSDGEHCINDIRNTVKIQFTNMSSGEFNFVQHFSSLYATIKSINKQGLQTVVVCLDEPDIDFHPEWSRKYINYLDLFVKTLCKKETCKFQFIISTHSPFMVSDIPSQFINCIEEKDGRSTITKASFGFASNFYDIIRSDFFMSSTIGEYALRKISEMTEQINSLANLEEGQISKLKKMIDMIGDDYLKHVLHNNLNNKMKELSE